MRSFLEEGKFDSTSLTGRLAIEIDDMKKNNRSKAAKAIGWIGQAVLRYETQMRLYPNREGQEISLQIALAKSGFNIFNKDFCKNPKDFCDAWKDAIALGYGLHGTLH
jgi:hypothetical protein